MQASVSAGTICSTLKIRKENEAKLKMEGLYENIPE